MVVVEALTSALQPISAGFLWQEERLAIADELRAGTSRRGLTTLLGRLVVARLTPCWGPSPVVRALPIVFPSRRLRLPHQSSA